jgi:lipoprotein-anchoring transpeptidase ErfK/SrfK
MLVAAASMPVTRAASPGATAAVEPVRAAVVTLPAPARSPDAVPRQLKINIAWQIALEAADFSPGIIDGAFKGKGTMALTDYAQTYFAGLDIYDPKVFTALKVDVDHAVTRYEITPDDAEQVGGPLPDDWNAKAQLQRLNYESMADCITEKFHCTAGLLTKLNPGIALAHLAAGQTLLVPNIRPFPTDNRVTLTRRPGAASVTVNLGEKTIRVFDRAGTELALFNCSVAKDKNKLPDRDTKVQVIASPNPQYTFNPTVWPEVHNVSQVLQIPAGPRNPVGLSWVGLDLPGYGIHGSPKPEMIGKTGSHGCFRLTNWDALKFAGFVQIGMPVKVINPDANPA